MLYFNDGDDLKKMLKSVLMTSEHIGFMEGNNQNEYKILELRDILEEMKEDLYAHIDTIIALKED